MKKLFTLIFIFQLSFFGYSQSSIDFKIIQNLIIVNAQVNGNSGYFIVDTGASVSVIDSRKDRKYGFDLFMSKDDRMSGFSGKTKLYRTSQIKLKLKGLKIESPYRFVACDLSDVNQSVKDVNIVGILGADFLINYKAMIDYSNNKIHLKYIY